MKHKHAELIKAWADGAEIERREIYCQYQMNQEPTIVREEWIRDISPSWGWMTEYRIKPEQQPDCKSFLFWSRGSGRWLEKDKIAPDANSIIRIIRDGKTGEIKSAEVR